MKLSELNQGFSTLIGAGALLSVVTPDGEANTMTVSWGASGVLWGKEICTVFVRPERHTYGLLEKTDKMTLSFFGDEKKDDLAFCGTKSGANVNKFEACDLKYSCDDGFVVIDEAKITLKLKVLYTFDLEKEGFCDTSPLKFYQNGGLHRAFVCEVI
ncbi:MAG: flavin reductase [Clostridia bacterium]|nr:flavin reductase [Clostridia bacterium]